MADTVTTRHAISGKVDKNTPVHIARHPILGKHLIEVPEGSKPFVPELMSSKSQRDEITEDKVELPKTEPTKVPKPNTPDKIGKD